MTRRERLERKVERRQDWAESAKTKSAQAFDRAHSLVKDIPLGQPILVGHYSEGAHRRVIDRMASAMDKGCELKEKASGHIGKAANLQHLLDKAIFSDDSDALEALEQRIAANEAKREQMKLVNKLYKKGDSAGLKDLGFNYETMKARLDSPETLSRMRQPYPAYELQNLGQRISTDRKRLDQVKLTQTRQKAAEEAPNGITITNHSNGYSSVMFAEKPDYAVIRSLKDAGFRWGSGHWVGQTANLPAAVSELIAGDQNA